MCLFWKIPSGLLRDATLKILHTFSHDTVCESFMAVHLLRTRDRCIPHWIGQI